MSAPASLLPRVVRTLDPLGSAVAVATQAAVFHLVPVLNQIYDGWPRGWLVLSLAVLAALLRGTAAGVAALLAGAAFIWWRGTAFAPMHPGLEVFAGLGLLQIAIIHRLRQHTNALKRAEVALRQANQEKDQFLALLSHELRTPLNVILGYGRLLETPMATGEFVPKAIQVIRRNASTQLRLVEDLLDVQRILQQGLRLEIERFELQPVVHAVMESLRLSAADKHLHWAERVEPITMEGDRARIEQVLSNLLANAVKFTPEGGCIGLTATAVDGHVIVQVEDSGPGMPSEFLPYAFEPFRQLDMSPTRRHGGLGLGLAIVKGIVDAHGGSVTADSEGNGTRVTIRLPLRRDADLSLA